MLIVEVQANIVYTVSVITDTSECSRTFSWVTDVSIVSVSKFLVTQDTCFKSTGVGPHRKDMPYCTVGRRYINPLTPTVAIWVQLIIKYPMPDRVKPSFVIFDIRAL